MLKLTLFSLLLAVSANAESLYFNFDSTEIREPELVAQLAERIKETHSKVIIVGSACKIGGRLYNLSLGQRRANAVYAALIAAGVPEDLLSISVSYGEEQPRSETLEENRRVDIALIQAEILVSQPIEVTVDQRPRSSNNVSLLGGVGPVGLDKDSLGSNSFRVDPEYKPVFGASYMHTFESQFSLGVTVLSNFTALGSLGYSF